MTPSSQATENPLKQALRHGQSLWYDGLIEIRHFETMMREDGVRGATTNPAIFEKALSHHDYDADIKALSKTQSPEKIYQTLSVRTVQRVCDVFLPVYKETGGKDGFVSIEVSPLLARDTQGTLAEARELWKLVGRENAMIKVPATREGLPAIRALIADGIHVNVTLIFGVERYSEVIDAYLSGLEDRAKAGKPVSGIASVASFFVSRVDSAVDKLLAEKGNTELQGRIAIANSKAAYRLFEVKFAGARFRELAAKGAQVQRPLWASTGTKNPAYSDVLYVETLIGPDTVNTMPPATLDAFRDHGKAAPRLLEGTDQALADLKKLESLGIRLLDVTVQLENQGVDLFADAYNKIIQLIGAKKS